MIGTPSTMAVRCPRPGVCSVTPGPRRLSMSALYISASGIRTAPSRAPSARGLWIGTASRALATAGGQRSRAALDDDPTAVDAAAARVVHHEARDQLDGPVAVGVSQHHHLRAARAMNAHVAVRGVAVGQRLTAEQHGERAGLHDGIDQVVAARQKGDGVLWQASVQERGDQPIRREQIVRRRTQNHGHLHRDGAHPHEVHRRVISRHDEADVPASRRQSHPDAGRLVEVAVEDLQVARGSAPRGTAPIVRNASGNRPSVWRRTTDSGNPDVSEAFRA